MGKGVTRVLPKFPMILFSLSTLSQTSPCFYTHSEPIFLKHCGKRRNKQVLVFSKWFFFYLFREPYAIFMKFKLVVCKSYSLKESKICVWERVKNKLQHFIHIELTVICKYFYFGRLVKD